MKTAMTLPGDILRTFIILNPQHFVYFDRNFSEGKLSIFQNEKKGLANEVSQIRP